MNRNRVIDAEKGLCMVLIIAGHSPYIPHIVESVITMFHVPMFFFVSAYLFNYTQNFFGFVKRKFNALLKPLFIVVLITSCASFGKELIMGDVKGAIETAFFSLVGGVLQWNGTSFEGQKWFMACLFSSLIIFYSLNRLFGENNYKRIVLGTFVLSIIGLVYCDRISIRLPWYIDISCATMYCWGIGYVSKKVINISTRDKICKCWFPISFMLLWTVVYLAKKNQSYVSNTVDIHNAVFGNWIYWILGAILGSALIAVLSMKWLKSCTILNYIGKNSIVFFLYAWTARPISDMVVEMWNRVGITNSVILWITEILVVLGVCSIETVLFSRYFPWIIGKKNDLHISFPWRVKSNE